MTRTALPATLKNAIDRATLMRGDIEVDDYSEYVVAAAELCQDTGEARRLGYCFADGQQHLFADVWLDLDNATREVVWTAACAGDLEAQSIRETVTETMHQQVKVALIKNHERNYKTLYVYPDGRLHWVEAAGFDESLVDDDDPASGQSIEARAHLVQVGTGSCDCNCDFESDDYSAMVECMDEGLAAVPQGYFDDEKGEDA